MMTSAAWNVNQSKPIDPITAVVDQSFAKGIAFSQWLTNVGAAATAGKILVDQPRHNLDAVVAPAQQWMSADPAQSPKTPLQFTFNTPLLAAPENQCGRVMFSD